MSNHQYISFKYGDTVKYNGQEAKIVSHNQSGNFLRIEVDGKIITVDKNDLFGMNTDYESDYDRQVANYNERIEENKNKIEHFQQLWYAAKDSIKLAREKIDNLFDSLGVTNVSQITNADKKKEYKSLKQERYDARMTQIRASADIIGTANDTVSLAINKGNLQNQQLFSRIV